MAASGQQMLLIFCVIFPIYQRNKWTVDGAPLLAMPLRRFTPLQQAAPQSQGILEGLQQLIEDNVKKKRIQMPSIRKETLVKYSKTLTSNGSKRYVAKQSIFDLSHPGWKSKPKILAFLDKISQSQNHLTVKNEDSSGYSRTSIHRTNIQENSPLYSNNHTVELKKIFPSLFLQPNTLRLRRDLAGTEVKRQSKHVDSTNPKQKYSPKADELKKLKSPSTSSGLVSLRETSPNGRLKERNQQKVPDFKKTPVNNLLPVALPLVAVEEVSINVTSSKNESETLRLWEASYYQDLVQRYRSKDSFWALLSMSGLLSILFVAVCYSKMWKTRDVPYWENFDKQAEEDIPKPRKHKFSIQELLRAKLRHFPKITLPKRKSKRKAHEERSRYEELLKLRRMTDSSSEEDVFYKGAGL